MEDNDLAKYISSYGDCLAIRNWCKCQTSNVKKKHSLFEKLRPKMEQTKANGAYNKSNLEHGESLGNAKKTED